MGGHNNDSDQSVSEEEDLGLESSENYSFSLSGSAENKKRSRQVLSQLETLRKDACELAAVTNATIPSEKRQTGLCVEDEIEFPVFDNEDNSTDCPREASLLYSDEGIDDCHGLASICSSDEEIIFDGEKLTPYTFRSAKVGGAGNTWSEVNREVEALVCLKENTASYLPVGSSSKLNKSSKGGQRKVKRNFLFRFQSREKAYPLVVANANAIGMTLDDRSQTKALHANANRDMQKLNMESLQALDGEKQEQNLLPFEGAYHDCNKHSLTELLECLKEKSCVPQGNSEMHDRLKGRRTKAVVSKSISALGDRKLDSLLEVGSSSEDEGILLNPKSVVQQRTMVDKFHEAFEAVSAKDFVPDAPFPRDSCVGLFEKLQHLMVIEKEKDGDFLKKFHIDGNSSDGRGFLDVRILTRSLEAKLNVCCCALILDEENSQWLNHFQMRNQAGERILNIIFSSRVCCDVELEVGNLIRIHSPWQEVNIWGKDEMIILCTYFTQM